MLRAASMHSDTLIYYSIAFACFREDSVPRFWRSYFFFSVIDFINVISLRAVMRGDFGSRFILARQNTTCRQFRARLEAELLNSPSQAISQYRPAKCILAGRLPLAPWPVTERQASTGLITKPIDALFYYLLIRIGVTCSSLLKNAAASEVAAPSRNEPGTIALTDYFRAASWSEPDLRPEAAIREASRRF